MNLRIKGRDLPGSRCGPGPDAPGGHGGLRVGVQRRGDAMQVLDPVAGDAAAAEWTVECAVRETAYGLDFTGPYVQGPPGQRFIYLSWLSDHGPGPLGMFRRGKIRLDALPEPVLQHAISGGTIEVEVRLTDDKGNPACATIGPPAVAWRIGSDQ
ncbi:MAG TPA: DUF5990 family protein [Mycobacteriales bacterium]|jgi:hypothetical protein|nr:DUF5990 family protein [Mycobacteriales bacterium]